MEPRLSHKDGVYHGLHAKACSQELRKNSSRVSSEHDVQAKEFGKQQSKGPRKQLREERGKGCRQTKIGA